MSEQTLLITIDELRKLLKFIAKGYKVPQIIYDTIKQAAIIEIENKHRPVLIKRDPNVERDRLSAFYPLITDNATIEICPPTGSGFGLDFDGDAMAVIALLSEEAQEEAKNKLLTPFSPEGLNKTTYKLSKEMVIGIFAITFLENEGNPIVLSDISKVESLHIGQKVKINYKGFNGVTTAGRIIFNMNLPEYVPFVNEQMSSKDTDKLLSKIRIKNSHDFIKTVDKLYKLGFKYSTLYPQSFSISDLEIPPELHKLKEELGKADTAFKQQNIIDQMDYILAEFLKKNRPDLYIIIKSGGAKGFDQLRQVLVAKGLLKDALGKILPPITESIGEGYSIENFFNQSASSRKGVIDRSINTAKGGYAYRKAIYCVGDVEGDITNPDCGSKRTLKIKLTQDLFNRMKGRYCINQKGSLDYVDESMIGTIINLRSPIYCKSKKICRICYGDLLYQLKSKNVGILAAMAVESLSEKIMKCSNGCIQHDNKLETMEYIWNTN